MFKIPRGDLCSADSETKYSLLFNDSYYQKMKIKLQFNYSDYEMCFPNDKFLFVM